MKHYLEETSDKMQHQINKKRKMASQLKKGDKVYLLTKNWKVKPPRMKKLDHIKVGPFLVEEKTNQSTSDCDYQEMLRYTQTFVSQ